DRAVPVTLTGVPVLLHPDNAHLGKGLSARIRGTTLFGPQVHGPLPLNTPVALPLTLGGAEASFFFDSVLEEDIEVFPGQPSPAMLGTRQHCAVTLEAPFKRFCFYGASVFSALLLLVLLVRVFVRPVADGAG